MVTDAETSRLNARFLDALQVDPAIAACSVLASQLADKFSNLDGLDTLPTDKEYVIAEENGWQRCSPQALRSLGRTANGDVSLVLATCNDSEEEPSKPAIYAQVRKNVLVELAYFAVIGSGPCNYVQFPGELEEGIVATPLDEETRRPLLEDMLKLEPAKNNDAKPAKAKNQTPFLDKYAQERFEKVFGLTYNPLHEEVLGLIYESDKPRLISYLVTAGYVNGNTKADVEYSLSIELSGNPQQRWLMLTAQVTTMKDALPTVCGQFLADKTGSVDLLVGDGTKRALNNDQLEELKEILRQGKVKNMNDENDPVLVMSKDQDNAEAETRVSAVDKALAAANLKKQKREEAHEKKIDKVSKRVAKQAIKTIKKERQGKEVSAKASGLRRHKWFICDNDVQIQKLVNDILIPMGCWVSISTPNKSAFVANMKVFLGSKPQLD